MRRARILGAGETAFYHVTSRVVDRRIVFDDDAKEFFRRTLRRLEAFMGLRVLTYCAMGNHFHVLVEVPRRREISDDELLERVEGFHPPARARALREEFETLREEAERTGDARRLDAWRARFLARMGSLSAFGKELKERVSRRHNRLRGRRGTLWEERFKSVLIEGSEGALAAVAAYVDLNPVRAGLVDDPAQYRFCGYAEALGGGEAAREGLRRLARIAGRGAEDSWRPTARFYRTLLFGAAEGRGVDPERARRVLAEGGRLSLGELISLRVRYFSDGLALGSKAFLEGVFEANRDRFGPKRTSGARPLRGARVEFACLRDLRREAILPPGGPPG